MKKREDFISAFLRWLPALIVMGIIFLVSSRPSTKLPEFGSLEPVVEIGGHMLGYGLLVLALCYAIGKKESKYLWVAAILAFLYGASDEIHQSFVPGRNASFFDLGIDLLGIFLGLSKVSLFQKFSGDKSLLEF